MKLQVETMAAANRGDFPGARAAAKQIVDLSKEPGQHPFL